VTERTEGGPDTRSRTRSSRDYRRTRNREASGLQENLCEGFGRVAVKEVDERYRLEALDTEGTLATFRAPRKVPHVYY
jgi:hypothetical protein